MLTVKFELLRTTKNKVVYQEIIPKGARDVVGTLYVSKWAAEDGRGSYETQMEVQFPKLSE